MFVQRVTARHSITHHHDCCYLWRHDDVIKWKHFPRYWPFVRGIHRRPVNSPHKGQWRGALMFSLICTWTNDWANNWEAGDLRRYRAHYDIIVMRNNAFLCLALLCLLVFLCPKTLRHNGGPFTHDIFKPVFLDVNCCILIKISLNVVP